MTGGFGAGFGAYDYNDYYGDYTGDYNYDYYDWVCSTNPPNCQLCNILGSECCDPDVDVNCFLPDTCLNNPCLSGGTCVTTKTLDDRPDFTCMCLPGLTGKYCQLATDYFVGAQFFAPPPMPLPLPMPLPPMPAPGPGAGPMASAPMAAAPGPYGQSGPVGPVAGQVLPGPARQLPSPGGVMPFQQPGLPLNVGLGRMPLSG
jgi:hypothetical protein